MELLHSPGAAAQRRSCLYSKIKKGNKKNKNKNNDNGGLGPSPSAPNSA